MLSCRKPLVVTCNCMPYKVSKMLFIRGEGPSRDRQSDSVTHEQNFSKKQYIATLNKLYGRKDTYRVFLGKCTKVSVY